MVKVRDWLVKLSALVVKTLEVSRAAFVQFLNIELETSCTEKLFINALHLLLVFLAGNNWRDLKLWKTFLQYIFSIL